MKASIFPFLKALRLSGSEFDSPHTYLKHLAETQTALADAFYMESRFEEALDAYEKVINIYRILVEDYSERYLADLAITINNWASLQGESGSYSVPARF